MNRGMSVSAVAELRAKGNAEDRLVTLTNAACMLAMDARSTILCSLSAEDNEWSDGDEIGESVERYRIFMATALDYAGACCGDPNSLVWGLMKQAAIAQGQQILLPWQ